MTGLAVENRFWGTSNPSWVESDSEVKGERGSAVLNSMWLKLMELAMSFTANCIVA